MHSSNRHTNLGEELVGDSGLTLKIWKPEIERCSCHRPGNVKIRCNYISNFSVTCGNKEAGC